MHTAILSHEDLYSHPKSGEALAKHARDLGISVQVVVFLRPFSQFVYGDYSQQMKQFFPQWLQNRRPYGGDSFDAFAHRRMSTLMPAQFISQWARLFPDLAPILASHRDIRNTLCRLLRGLCAVDWTVHRDLTNPSLRLSDCEALADALRDPNTTDAQAQAMFRAAFHAAGQPDPGRTDERTQMIERIFPKFDTSSLISVGIDRA